MLPDYGPTYERAWTECITDRPETMLDLLW